MDGWVNEYKKENVRAPLLLRGLITKIMIAITCSDNFTLVLAQAGISSMKIEEYSI